MKRAIVYIGALAFNLLIPISANAANWEFYADSGSISKGDYNMFLIDTESIRSLGNNRFTIWDKTDLSKNKNVKANFEIAKSDIDCAARKYRIRSFTSYSRSGEPLVSLSWNEYEAEWKDAIPESIAEAMVDRVCEK